MTAVLGLVATVSVVTATPSAAEGRDYQPVGAGKAAGVERPGDFQTQTTNGNSFLEINGAGNLVYWQRGSGGFVPQVRGWGWQGTRIVTTLSPDTFIEVKGDGRLSKWTWDGTYYYEQVVGYGWQNARLLTGLSWNKFLEVNHQGNLVIWEFDAANNLFLNPVGGGWGSTRIITGLDDFDFLEVKGDGRLSEWIANSSGLLEEFEFYGTNFSAVRLMAGTDAFHFLIIDAIDGGLWEFTLNESDQTWYPVQVGGGWGGTRVIG